MSQVRWWFPSYESPLRFGVRKDYGGAIDYLEVNGLNLIADGPAGGAFQFALFDSGLVLPEDGCGYSQKGVYNPTQAGGCDGPSKITLSSADGSDLTVVPNLWEHRGPADFRWRQEIAPVLAPWAWHVRLTSTHTGTDKHPNATGQYSPYLLPSMDHLEFDSGDFTPGDAVLPHDGVHYNFGNGRSRWLMAYDPAKDVAFALRYKDPKTWGLYWTFDAVHVSAWPTQKDWSGTVSVEFDFVFGSVKQVRNYLAGLSPVPLRKETMKSTLGFHVSAFARDDIFDAETTAQPKIFKVFNYPSREAIERLRGAAPGALGVYRFYFPKDFPNVSADEFFAAFQNDFSKLQGLGLIFEGLNEPTIKTVGDAVNLNAWYVRWAEIIHGFGEKTAAFSFSTGNPDVSLVPYLADAARANDYIALHQYADANSGLEMVVQHRAFLAALPADARKPVLITEAGLDGGNGPSDGWKAHLTDVQYLALLAQMDSIYAADGILWVVYQYGDGDWGSFEISPILKPLASYVATANVVPAQPPAPTPPPTPPAPVYLEGLDFSHYQGVVDWAQVKASGRVFAFIKATEGTALVDDRFAANWARAKATGFYRAAFHYFRNNLDPLAQAKFFCDTLGSDIGEFAPVVDVEDVDALGDPDILSAFCKAVADRLQLTSIVIYTGEWYWDGAKYWKHAFTWTLPTPLWVSDMTSGAIAPHLPSDWKTWRFWQYGQSNSVPGISGAVDLDRFEGSLDDLKALVIPAPTPNPAPPPPPPPTPAPIPTPTPVTGGNVTSPSDPRLAAYPRPDSDNGLGIAFRLNLREDDNHPFVSQGVSWAKSLGVKWSLVAGQDWNQVLLGAKALYAAGIMPVCRLICTIDGHYDFVVGTKLLQAAGIPAYVQVFNEPGDKREWRNAPDIGRFGGAWAQHAALVFDAGGYPGLQILGKDEFDAAVSALKANNRIDILKRAWFCLHNYGANHPPAYPYDPQNQKDRPGATIFTDDTAVLRFLEYRQWMVDAFGFSLPLIGGEGGWEAGAENDDRYPKLDPPTHADYHAQMVGWFASGKLSNGDPLPDELFSVMPWIMADWGVDDWFRVDANGNNLGLPLTVAAYGKASGFVRQFGGVAPAPTPTPPPPVPVPPPTPTPPPTPAPLTFDYAVEPPGTVVAGFPDFLTVKQGAEAGVEKIILLTDQPSDDPASQLGINVNCDVRDSGGDPLDGEAVEQIWPDGSSTHYTINGTANFQLFGSFKGGQAGPYTVQYRDASVAGLGLQDAHHVQWIILFRRIAQ